MSDVTTATSAAIPPHKIHFQCLVDLSSKTIVGYEALARFADGRSPQEHLAEALANDQLVALELSLLRSAVAAAEAIPERFAVTLNASAETLDSPEMDGLLPAGRDWGIELAETSVPEPDDRLSRRAHELGALLLIDDAGTAHATIDWVTTLQPDVVKVDRSVIQSACHDLEARRELAAFVAAARDVGARVAAEGIETESHAQMAATAGVDWVQGWHYGRPEPYAS